jgi:hypothetical protein
MNTVLDNLLAALNVSLRETDNEATQAAIIAALGTITRHAGFKITFRSSRQLWTAFTNRADRILPVIEDGLECQDSSTHVDVEAFTPG